MITLVNHIAKPFFFSDTTIFYGLDGFQTKKRKKNAFNKEEYYVVEEANS